MHYKNWKLCAPPLGTFKDVVVTKDSIKAWLAFTDKAVDIVLADGTIPAGLAGTLVHFSLAVLAFKSRAAVTRESSNGIHTGASVQARVYRKREAKYKL